eukprot:CAMPEP_0198360922 /NCGR_PEP_ID=MMETSP1450-20131203/140294_1 /TAXON_ID=753684 ORGANISM="Madagascaria erythrocladiodes, Strain CCMP3234" /NCGR_SAMPLE_ID=MMETSP1450 /ASSEMBLY_ACC=CAM_ASM_001115 /LENGTH=64 /DNA_ID=CAMNT_0044067985 /DNA_START=41 /DNA_END=233 /DNA_ORIENTATION=+
MRQPHRRPLVDNANLPLRLPTASLGKLKYRTPLQTSPGRERTSASPTASDARYKTHEGTSQTST